MNAKFVKYLNDWITQKIYITWTIGLNCEKINVINHVSWPMQIP